MTAIITKWNSHGQNLFSSYHFQKEFRNTIRGREEKTLSTSCHETSNLSSSAPSFLLPRFKAGPSCLCRSLPTFSETWVVIIQFFSPLSSTSLHPDLLPQGLIYSSFTFILKKKYPCPYGLHCLLVHSPAFTSEVVLCKVLNEFLILASEGHVFVVTLLTLE